MLSDLFADAVEKKKVKDAEKEKAKKPDVEMQQQWVIQLRYKWVEFEERDRCGKSQLYAVFDQA